MIVLASLFMVGVSCFTRNYAAVVAWAFCAIGWAAADVSTDNFESAKKEASRLGAELERQRINAAIAAKDRD